MKNAPIYNLAFNFHTIKDNSILLFQAFCLASFAYNDKALKKLMENFGCYSDKLQEDKVYEAFNTIITQSKKLPKTENKVILDELSAKIEEERAKQV
jgi:condensin complex subunit 1